jgi:hypothetical protein
MRGAIAYIDNSTIWLTRRQVGRHEEARDVTVLQKKYMHECQDRNYYMFYFASIFIPHFLGINRDLVFTKYSQNFSSTFPKKYSTMVENF